jgi:hypothetical protein
VHFFYRTADAKAPPQSIARTARTVLNVAVCRTFLRSVLQWLIDPQRMVTDRHDRYRQLIDCVDPFPASERFVCTLCYPYHPNR